MKKKWYIALAVLLFLICGVLLWLMFRPAPKMPEVQQDVQQAVSDAVKQEPAVPSEPEQPEAPEEPPYVSPVDCETLWEINPEIYGWLYIPGTDINYPLLQREGDDRFYLDHNSEGEPDQNGSLFTESAYNSKDFSDPVTVIYGHHMRSGAMFGNLQSSFSSAEALKELNETVVYLPETEIHYQVFAGIPFSGIHILYYYDFQNKMIFQAFLDHIQTKRGIDANINQDVCVTTEDQLLILSTCLQGNNKNRYLVLAKRMDDRSTSIEKG